LHNLAAPWFDSILAPWGVGASAIALQPGLSRASIEGLRRQPCLTPTELLRVAWGYEPESGSNQLAGHDRLCKGGQRHGDHVLGPVFHFIQSSAVVGCIEVEQLA